MYQRRDFYRHARYVHGWLSAFAFIVLIFFAATGLFLNNPDWFKSKNEEQTTTFTLLESPAGSTDLWVLLDNGDVEITQKPATTVSLLNDLHRGKNVGTAWHWLIDISAIIIILLSLAGYILFLTIKTRLVTHLLLTACSLSAIILLIWSAI